MAPPVGSMWDGSVAAAYHAACARSSCQQRRLGSQPVDRHRPFGRSTPPGHRPLSGRSGAGTPAGPSGRWPTPTSRAGPTTSDSWPRTWRRGAAGSSTPGCWPGSPGHRPRPRCWATGQLAGGHRPHGHPGLGPSRGREGHGRGAAEVGALMVLSSLATCSLEDVAAAAPGAPRWMQIYILRDRARTVDLVQPDGGARIRRPRPHRRRPGLRTPPPRASQRRAPSRPTCRCPTWPGTARPEPTKAASWPW